MTRDDEALTAKIPADVDQPDKILYGLTVRQLAILAATAAVGLWVYLVTSPWLPLPAVVAAVFPIVAAGLVLATARRDGMSLDRFALAALDHLRHPRERVHAPEGIEPPPPWCRVRGRLPEPLRLPVRTVRQDGVLELADGGTAVMVRAGTITFALRTHAEQAALVTAFGRWLNSLDAPAQILVRTRAVDLSDLARQVAEAAPHLPDPALEEAAEGHAAYLAELSSARDLLVREVLIVIRDHLPGRPQARPWARGTQRRTARQAGAAVVLRRAEEAVHALAVLGIAAEVLDGPTCVQVLAESLSPGEPPLATTADPQEVVTTHQPEEAPQ
ncbi:hypothetical protein Acsp04_65050 [Actinomadura sp. NBRC 104425]|uniref:PrgI family protein n=1 Tax=Actinomadura sp. NBRC 104425 TaxID=3032204 RepID=UPI0024A562BB|nr:PrgI family protein [Actinomadura sp. NBRC 104425]GLZ16270.1 hypothetical protein Acsp04_65050 [Actinomadura sp. NBRC 104425]